MSIQSLLNTAMKMVHLTRALRAVVMAAWQAHQRGLQTPGYYMVVLAITQALLGRLEQALQTLLDFIARLIAGEGPLQGYSY